MLDVDTQCHICSMLEKTAGCVKRPNLLFTDLVGSTQGWVEKTRSSVGAKILRISCSENTCLLALYYYYFLPLFKWLSLFQIKTSHLFCLFFPGIATKEKISSSCWGSAIVDALLWCSKLSLHLPLGKPRPGSSMRGIIKVNLTGKQSEHGLVSFAFKAVSCIVFIIKRWNKALFIVC